MEDVMALFGMIVLLTIGGSITATVSVVFKKLTQALKGAPKVQVPQRREEPVFRQMHTPEAEGQLARAMKNAAQNAAARGESWARKSVGSAGAAHRVHGQGEHESLAPSAEGVYTRRSEGHEGPQADACRAVGSTVQPPEEAEVLTVERAVRKKRAAAQNSKARGGLEVTPQSLQQGLIWNEILNKRGGRGRIH